MFTTFLFWSNQNQLLGRQAKNSEKLHHVWDLLWKLWNGRSSRHFLEERTLSSYRRWSFWRYQQARTTTIYPSYVPLSLDPDMVCISHRETRFLWRELWHEEGFGLKENLQRDLHGLWGGVCLSVRFVYTECWDE